MGIAWGLYQLLLLIIQRDMCRPMGLTADEAIEKRRGYRKSAVCPYQKYDSKLVYLAVDQPGLHSISLRLAWWFDGVLVRLRLDWTRDNRKSRGIRFPAGSRSHNHSGQGVYTHVPWRQSEYNLTVAKMALMSYSRNGNRGPGGK